MATLSYIHKINYTLSLKNFFLLIIFFFINLEQAKEAGLTEGGVTLEDGFSTFELRQSSRRNTLSSKRGTLKSSNGTARRSSNLAMINSSRAPPRPTPSLVNYSDEDSAKGYDENPDDSDSLTEKPSEISSTDSQVLLSKNY